MIIKDLKALIKDAPEHLEVKILANGETLDCAASVEDAIVVSTVYTEVSNYMGLYLFGE